MDRSCPLPRAEGVKRGIFFIRVRSIDFLIASETKIIRANSGRNLLQISQLLEEVQRLQVSITKLQESSMSQIGRLEEELEQKKQQIARLEARLDLQRDYEDLKREIG